MIYDLVKKRKSHFLVAKGVFQVGRKEMRKRQKCIYPSKKLPLLPIRVILFILDFVPSSRNVKENVWYDYATINKEISTSIITKRFSKLYFHFSNHEMWSSYEGYKVVVPNWSRFRNAVSSIYYDGTPSLKVDETPLFPNLKWLWIWNLNSWCDTSFSQLVSLTIHDYSVNQDEFKTSKLPMTLKCLHIFYGCDKLVFDVLPNDLQTLVIESYFAKPFTCTFPSQLQELKIKSQFFNHPLPELPSSLIVFEIGELFNQECKLDHLTNLEQLHFYGQTPSGKLFLPDFHQNKITHMRLGQGVTLCSICPNVTFLDMWGYRRPHPLFTHNSHFGGIQRLILRGRPFYSGDLARGIKFCPRLVSIDFRETQYCEQGSITDINRKYLQDEQFSDQLLRNTHEKFRILEIRT